MSDVNSTVPENNPLYAALSALAAPEEWASVTALPQIRPHRFRVELVLLNSNVARRIELKLPSERAIADVWEEFNQWYVTPRSLDTFVR